MNRRMIIAMLGKMLCLEGLLLLFPVLIALLYQEREGVVYAGCALGLSLFGWVLNRIPMKHTRMYAREGFLIVALSWITFSVFGALPFWFSGEIPSYVDAFFEIVSGFTTTGSSILTDVEALSHTALFWRSFSHWVGGMGILVLMVAFLRNAKGNTLHILKAEMPGPVVGKLVSKVNVTAWILYYLYLFLTCLEVLLLVLGGMPLFDSLLNAFATAGTGGFAIKNASIAYYQSAYLEGVITVFMFLFGINFNLIYFFLLGKFKAALQSQELRWYAGIVLGATVLITFNILDLYSSLWEALRYALFQVVSIITTTGFVTADYGLWPLFSQTILIMLMFIGACAGSTGGGIKVSRILLYLKSARRNIRRQLHPNTVVSMNMDGRPVNNGVMQAAYAYLVFYLIIFAGSLLIVTLDNMDFTSSFSAVATTLNNVGPALHVAGPVGNFSSFSDLSKIVMSFDMLAGRLEIFPLILLFSYSTWKK